MRRMFVITHIDLPRNLCATAGEILNAEDVGLTGAATMDIVGQNIKETTWSGGKTAEIGG